MTDLENDYVPGRWGDVQKIVSRAMFRGGQRPELRFMADALSLKVVQALIDAGYWVCRRRKRGTGQPMDA
jgi:hypothetical protein